MGRAVRKLFVLLSIANGCRTSNGNEVLEFIELLFDRVTFSNPLAEPGIMPATIPPLTITPTETPPGGFNPPTPSFGSAPVAEPGSSSIPGVFGSAPGSEPGSSSGSNPSASVGSSSGSGSGNSFFQGCTFPFSGSSGTGSTSRPGSSFGPITSSGSRSSSGPGLGCYLAASIPLIFGSRPGFNSGSGPGVNPTTLPPLTSPPTGHPSLMPSDEPSENPTTSQLPTDAPSGYPTILPSWMPTPTPIPSYIPSLRPTGPPSLFKSSSPTSGPTPAPTQSPTTAVPPSDPTESPTRPHTNAPIHYAKPVPNCVKSYNELVHAIKYASNYPLHPTTILLCPRPFYVQKDIQITGKAFKLACATTGCRLSGYRQTRIFRGAPSYAVLQGITFSEGVGKQVAPYGGAIYLSGGTMAIDRCDFVDNGAVLGGAIFSAGDTQLTISRSSFNQNHAGTDGGAVYVSESKIVIDDSTFSYNEAGRFGGGIHFAPRTVGYLNGLDFVYNKNPTFSQGGGGALSVLNAKVFVKTSTFSYNASPLGKDIYIIDDDDPGTYGSYISCSSSYDTKNAFEGNYQGIVEQGSPGYNNNHNCGGSQTGSSYSVESSTSNTYGDGNTYESHPMIGDFVPPPTNAPAQPTEIVVGGPGNLPAQPPSMIGTGTSGNSPPQPSGVFGPGPGILPVGQPTPSPVLFETGGIGNEPSVNPAQPPALFGNGDGSNTPITPPVQPPEASGGISGGLGGILGGVLGPITGFLGGVGRAPLDAQPHATNSGTASRLGSPANADAGASGSNIRTGSAIGGPAPRTTGFSLDISIKPVDPSTNARNDEAPAETGVPHSIIVTAVRPLARNTDPTVELTMGSPVRLEASVGPGLSPPTQSPTRSRMVVPPPVKPPNNVWSNQNRESWDKPSQL